VICPRFGGPEVLELGEVDEPAAGPGQLLVQVRACAVNFPDLLMIANRYQFKPTLPFVPGSEVAGVVVACGEGVDRFSPGDRVLGSSIYVGGLAERAVLAADTTQSLPGDVDFADAAGLLYSYGTSHHALKDRARLRPGESLLVLGAAGAVGLAAVELGALMGARVIAAASSASKLELARSRGAADVVDYSREDLKARVRDLTGGEGADVVYDPVGGPYSEPALRATAWDGRFLVVGFAAGDIPRLPLNLVLLRGASVVGVFWGSFVGRHPDRHRANVAELLKWWRAGRLRPHTHAVRPLGEAAAAFSDLAERRSMGKVVVVP
jgi:NADPH2:quinone reductase